MITIPPRAANAYIGENLSEVFWKPPLHKRFAHELAASAAEAHLDMAADCNSLSSFAEFSELVGGLKEAAKQMLRDQMEEMIYSINEEIDALEIRPVNAIFNAEGFVDGSVLIDTVKAE